ncbi:hypothetical protein ACHAXR_006584, partial [Thalassiosira sp. AJA248-18]
RRLAVCGAARFLAACQPESQIISQNPPSFHDGPSGSESGGNNDAFLYTGQQVKWSDIRDVTHVRVDPSVKVIEKCAFQGCERLIWVELCEGLEAIDERAFARCKGLKHIKIPSSVKKIGNFAFKGCEQLLAVDFSEGLQEINESAFSACISLKRLKIPSSTNVIGNGAFSFCDQLAEVELRKGLVEIHENAFNGCKSLEQIKIPNTVKLIGNSAFRNCGQLEQVDLCDGLEQIGGSAFYCCRSLKCISIPSSVKVISLGAFHRCETLVVVELCEGVELIEERAFCSCFHLKFIRIPSSVKVIDKFSFYECNRLEKVKLCEGLQDIRESAFYGCKTLKSVWIPSSVKILDKWVFASCHRLIKVNLCVGLQEIKEGAFWNCKSLKRVVVPPVKVIGNSAFRGCTQLEEVELTGAMEQIGLSAFSSRESLTRVKIPSSDIEDWDMMAETLCRAGASLEFIKTLLLTQQETFPENSTNWQKVARALTVSCLARIEYFENFHNIWTGMVGVFHPSQSLQGLVQSVLGLQQRFFPDQNNADWQILCEEMVNPLKGWWHHEDPATSLKTFHFLVKCNIPERLSAIGIRKWRMEIKSMVETVPPTAVSEMSSEFYAIHSKLASYEIGYHQLKQVTTLLELALWKSKISQSEETGEEGYTSNQKGLCRIKCGADFIIPNVLPYLIGD